MGFIGWQSPIVKIVPFEHSQARFLTLAGRALTLWGSLRGASLTARAMATYGTPQLRFQRTGALEVAPH